MNFERANEMDCYTHMPTAEPAPTPITTIKETVDNNYKTVREIDYILSAIEAQIFGADANKLSEPEDDTLYAALICTNGILGSIMGRLYQFASRMGVQI